MPTVEEQNAELVGVLEKIANTVPDLQIEVLSGVVLADACAEIEKRGQVVQYLVMPPETMPLLGRSLWGTRILYPEETEGNRGYAIGERGVVSCFMWEKLPEIPQTVTVEGDLPTKRDPVFRSGSCCPHCGKGIIVALLREDE